MSARVSVQIYASHGKVRIDISLAQSIHNQYRYTQLQQRIAYWNVPRQTVVLVVVEVVA